MDHSRGYRRIWNFAGLAACASLFGYALYAQHVAGLEPCPLCILQRVAVMALGVVFLAAALHDPRGWIARAYGLLLAAVALTGAGVAGWHVRLQHLPAREVPACGPGLEYMLDAFPLFEAMKMVFAGSGECADVDWSLVGLSMPAWVLISFVVLGGLGIVVNWSAGETEPAIKRIDPR